VKSEDNAWAGPEHNRAAVRNCDMATAVSLHHFWAIDLPFDGA
jgi:hypothetical protein